MYNSYEEAFLEGYLDALLETSQATKQLQRSNPQTKSYYGPKRGDRSNQEQIMERRLKQNVPNNFSTFHRKEVILKNGKKGYIGKRDVYIPNSKYIGGGGSRLTGNTYSTGSKLLGSGSVYYTGHKKPSRGAYSDLATKNGYCNKSSITRYNNGKIISHKELQKAFMEGYMDAMDALYK